MAHHFPDVARETSTITGTGAYSLTGGLIGFGRFGDVLANGDTAYYRAVMGNEWEIGLGTWGTGHVLTRTTILRSTNGNAAVNWGAGTKVIYAVAPGDWLELLAKSADVVAKAGDTMSGDLTVSKVAAAPSITLDSSDPRQRYYRISTNGVLRWAWGGGSVAESGGNAGSAFTFVAFNDAGGQIGTVYQIDRATRQLQYHAGGTAAVPNIAWIGDTGTGIYRVDVSQIGFATGGVLRFTIGATQLTSTLPIVLPASDPTSANQAARKQYVDNQVGTKLNTASPAATTSLSVTRTGNPEVRLISTGVRTWTHYVEAATGLWGLYDATAGAVRLTVDTAGNVQAGVAMLAPFIKSTGEVRAIGGVSFADSGDFAARFSTAWVGGNLLYAAINGNGIGYIPYALNVRYFRATGDSTSPYLEYTDTSGAVFGARSFTSDAKFKENIQPVNTAFLPLIRAIKPKSFDWREGAPGKGHNPLGLVAQDVQASIPSAVHSFGQGEHAALNLDPIALIAALIGAVTELATSNEAQSQTILDLQRRLGTDDSYLPKLVVVDRLIARGSLMAALAALNSDPVAKARWDAAVSIARDDPAVMSLLQAIGEDPAVILAPQETV